VSLAHETGLLETLGRNEDGLPEDVHALATLLSPAPYVPFRLLRRVRRAVLPARGLDVEAQLCESPLVESMADDGFVLEASARRRMHGQLRAAVLGGAHRGLAELETLLTEGLTGLPVMIRREAELTWLYVSREDPLQAADALLLEVVDMVALQGRTRLLTWVAGALRRLPADLLGTTGAWVLSQLCAAQDLPYPEIEPPDPAEVPALLDRASWLLRRRSVAFHRDGQTTEFGRVGGRRRCAMDVPATSPLLLWVSADGAPETVVRADGDSDAPASVVTGRGPVSIRAADGTTLELAAFDGPVAPEITALDRSLDRLEGLARSKQDLVVRVAAPSAHGDGWFVEIEDESAPWAWMPRAYAQSWHTEDMLGHTLQGPLRVRVERMERSTQRVTVRRIRGRWSEGALTEGDQVQGTLVAKTVGRLVFWLNESVGLPQPEFEPLLGVASNSAIPRSDIWRSASANRPTGRSARSFPMALGTVATLTVKKIDRVRGHIAVSLVGAAAPSSGWPPPQAAVGARVTAVVREPTEFGFLAEQVAGVPDLVGLVPNVELSWLVRWMRNGGAEEHPLRLGDEFAAVVVGHDHEKRQVHLSLKRLGPDPAVAFRRGLRIGETVDGTLLMRRQGGGWWVNIDPWAVTASVLDQEIHEVEPAPRLRIRGTIRNIRPDGSGITLRDVTGRTRSQ
jgi:hypothetical protein